MGAPGCGVAFWGFGACATDRFGETSSRQRMSLMGRLAPTADGGISHSAGGTPAAATCWRRLLTVPAMSRHPREAAWRRHVRDRRTAPSQHEPAQCPSHPNVRRRLSVAKVAMRRNGLPIEIASVTSSELGGLVSGQGRRYPYSRLEGSCGQSVQICGPGGRLCRGSCALLLPHACD